jgi:regulator of sigma E protease
MLAGVAMNLLAAFVIFTALAWLGMPQLIDNQFTVKNDTRVLHRDVLVGSVESDSPAAKAGLQARDQLLSLQAYDTAHNSIISNTPTASSKSTLTQATDYRGKKILYAQNIASAAELPKITRAHVGQYMQVVYERGGKKHAKVLQLRTEQQAKGTAYLGLSPAEFTLTRATWSAPIQALGLIKQFTIATFQGLGTALSALFHGQGAKASEQVSGPVGIVVVLRDGSLLGYQFVLLIIGLISLSLAIMNVLPIPALDGGRFYVLLLSRIFGKKLSQDMEERIVGTSFVFLLVLIVIITIVDVKRFF